MDGIVELNGKGLLLEWKAHPTPILGTGQGFLFKRLTKGKILSVICVAGDAESMVVSDVAKFFDGIWKPWRPATLADVSTLIEAWVKWTEK